MRKRIVVGVLLVLVALIGASIFYFQRHENEIAQARTPVSFRLAWVYDMAEAGVFVAQDKGYFQAQGLDVKIEPGGFGSDPIKLVAAGTDDYRVTGAGNILLARAQGVPVVAIGAEFQNTPVGFIVHKDSGILGFRDFRGKRIGIQTGSDTDVLYRALLSRNSMTSNDLREVPIQFDVTPFVSGQIDVLPGYVTNQPVTLENQGIAVDVISASSQGLNYYGNVYFTSEKMLREHPERVKAFLRAVEMGWNTAFQSEPDAVLAVKNRATGFKDSDLHVIYGAVMPFIHTNGDQPLLSMSGDRWGTTQQVLLDAGLLKNKVDLSKAYTNDFIK